MQSPSTVSDLENGNEKPFISGVVEGFYGRPWTLDQRKDLFTKMQEWGLNSYLYAPKDDYKHRAYWRELYSVEEAEHLTALIAAAKECNIMFLYALSPGLDITYSSTKEMLTLKRKLDQVVQFGCTAFALLFDDIEPEMSESDKEAFQSFAQAQVSVTNEIYQHLNQPKGFLFCPTQYCASRAVPDVRNSEYLNTIGSKLAPGIDILWTGDKVVSRFITTSSIDEVSDVFRRKPVIWDNLHANDYDKRRLFLGPYCGRPAALLSKLKGVLTNPNCEYGANFVAIHTVAQWCQCSADSGANDSSDAVSADIKLEQESAGGRSDEDGNVALPTYIYHPRSALKKSLQLWLNEFKKNKSMWGPMTQPHTSVAPPVTDADSTTSTMVASTTASGVNEDANLEGGIEASTNPCAVDGTESAGSASMASLERMADGECNLEPMETVETNSSASSQAKNADVLEEDVVEEDDDKVDDKEADEDIKDVVMKETERKDDDDFQLNIDDLFLLCDVFYLPFEHGPQGTE
nr:EOG090X01OH [Sida crystallina]